MRVFVTGAAGFIGSRLSKALLDRNDEVIGFDNLNDYYALEHKQRHLSDLLPQTRFRFIKGDLSDAPELRKTLADIKPDAVAHLAAMAAVRYSVEHPLIYGQVNVQGTMNLLDAARHLGKPRCILASTGSTYGKDTPVPFKETAAADRPLAPYPASKRAMELLAHSYHHLWDLPTTVLRFFNVYGPHGRPDMMPWIWSQTIRDGKPITLYGSGKLKRDWTFIDDIVAGFIAAIDKPQQYEIINLGCSQPVENLQFVQILEELVGRKANIVDTPTPPSEPLISFADITKARQLLGYEPKVNFREGLARFIRWMRQENYCKRPRIRLILPTMADSTITQVLDEETLSILRCPVTRSKLRLEEGYLIGEVGGLRYPVRNGIPVLLAEEATLPPGIESLEAFRAQFGAK